MYNESILRTDTLSADSLRDILCLVHLCERHDNQHFEYPLHEEGQLHWLLYTNQENRLEAALTLIPIDEETVECCACTRPDARRNGCFSRLLAQAEEEAGDRYLLFAVKPVPDTLAVLNALDAECISVEHRMERTLSDDDRRLPEWFSLPDVAAVLPANVCSVSREPSHVRILKQADNISGSGEQWALAASHPAGTSIASCRITPVGDFCVCLHQVEVAESMRKKGYGSALLLLLFQVLSRRNIQSIVLHVSEDNTAAIALYKKTGFRITETLSCYLY